jgi:hypothetical protein
MKKRKVFRIFHILILFFISGNFYAQKIESIQLKKTTVESDYYPQIEGFFQGEIPIIKLGSLDGFITKIGWKILSFEMNYISGRDYKTQRIYSNVIPDSIIVDISQNSMNEQIFFSKIMAIDDLKVAHLLNSMTLIPIKKQDE